MVGLITWVLKVTRRSCKSASAAAIFSKSFSQYVSSSQIASAGFFKHRKCFLERLFTKSSTVSRPVKSIMFSSFKLNSWVSRSLFVIAHTAHHMFKAWVSGCNFLISSNSWGYCSSAASLGVCSRSPWCRNDCRWFSSVTSLLVCSWPLFFLLHLAAFSAVLSKPSYVLSTMASLTSNVRFWALLFASASRRCSQSSWYLRPNSVFGLPRCYKRVLEKAICRSNTKNIPPSFSELWVSTSCSQHHLSGRLSRPCIRQIGCNLCVSERRCKLEIIVSNLCRDIFLCLLPFGYAIFSNLVVRHVFCSR